MKKLLIFTVGLLIMMSILVNCAAAASVQYPENGHYYDAISIPQGITWNDAKTAAQSSGGHLATITSQGENDFIVNNFGYLGLSSYWLGGFQPSGSSEPSGGWQWVTGESWSYTNWYWGEPNNWNGGESALSFWNSNQWNDNGENAVYPGYIVEYESTTTSVPEFPSMVLPVAAIVGLLIIFGRRKT